jgi:hypothetical protein
MSGLVTEFWPYLVLIMVGFLPNEIWRMLGVVLAHGVDEGSELLIWVRSVATAVLAGVVGKLILFPSGALAGVPFGVRIAAACAGLLAFLLVRRSLVAGVVAGEATLVLGAMLFG